MKSQKSSRLFRILPALPLAFLILTMMGCAYPISPGLRQQARQDLPFTSVFANPDAYHGSLVIWGGIIEQVDNQNGGTSVTVLAYPLNWQERPKTWTEPQGRFIVMNSRFLDPAVYLRGRRITVAGEVAGSQTRPFGNTEYRFPVLQAREIFLWPNYYPVYLYGYYPYYYGYPYDYGPYYNYYGPYGGWWYDKPYYYAPFGFRGSFGWHGGEHDGGGHGGGHGGGDGGHGGGGHGGGH